MTTLGTIKAEMASILKRGDLTTEIGEAVAHVIAELQNEPLWFKETKTATFTCVADQVYYTTADDADIPLMGAFADLHIRISNNDYSLRRIRDIGEFEALNDGNVSSGQPYAFIFYAQSIGLYPPPDDTYTVTMYGSYDVAAPATDGEASNVWMTKAYRLVMYRALAWLNRVRIRNFELAQQFELEAARELERLYTRTNRLKSNNRLIPTCW
jgi:hypothetical protein